MANQNTYVAMQMLSQGKDPNYKIAEMEKHPLLSITTCVFGGQNIKSNLKNLKY